MDPSAALQAAVRALLAADTDLQAELGDPIRIFDNPVAGDVYPFLTLGVTSGRDWSSQTFYGRDAMLDLHVWGEKTSEAGGKARVYDILHKAERALRDYRLTISGGHHVLTWFQDSRVLLDPDGRTIHGVASFRALTQET